MYAIRMKLLVGAALSLTILACATVPKLEVGPTHYAMTAGSQHQDLTGTWKTSGTFFGKPAEGQEIVFHTDKLNPFFWAERKDANGKLVARGWALSEGDKVYVAWSSDEAGKQLDDGQPLSFRLRLFKLKPAGFEGVSNLFRRAFSGPYGSTGAPGALQDGADAIYHVVADTGLEAPQEVELHLAPQGGRYLVAWHPIFEGMAQDGDIGTGLLSGDVLAAAFVSAGIGDASKIAVGVYTLNGTTVSGQTALMGTENQNRDDGLGISQTLRLPPTDESWTKVAGK